MIIAKRAALLALAALAAAGCGSSHHADIHVGPDGRVGPLLLQRSTRADVIAFAGKPESEMRGRYDGYGPYIALGYACDGRKAIDKYEFPGCGTVFYIYAQTGRLEEFYSAEPRFVGPRGIRPGMAATTAERLAHRRLPTVGCLVAWTFPAKKGGLTATFAGTGKHTHIDFFVLVREPHAAGVFDCIDS